MSKGASHEELIICASAIPVAEGGRPLTRIRMVPMGEFRLKDGRGPYRVRDVAHAAEIVAAAIRYWNAERMSYDYDHQTLSAKKYEGTAKASAWIDPAKITAEPDGIYANDVEWTAAAAQAIVDKEYLYFSPLFGASKTGDITNLYGGGLTNDPAIGGLTAIAASRFFQHQQESKMSFARIAAVFPGLGATATEDEVIAAATAQTRQIADLRTAIGAKDGDPHESVVAAAATLKPVDQAKVAGDGQIIVAASAFNDMAARLTQLEHDKIVEVVAAGRKAGKIPPQSEQSMLDWAKADFKAFSKWLETAVEVVPASSNLPGKIPAGDPALGLSADELVAASALNMTPEEYAKGKK
ncbi:phage protease [Asticcacaulis sp. YBE204]|uniref:phage protease n=1 Tax=Asticcacaulis sp. YBE204 TaxID=1282363 RepID=UPI0003C3D45D|nr:phage protease [Asticcacaulis sp. YBE204]ESQ78504.1 hypothetical protein AEYBE204_13210 [Asticcacaulis sp. YBE204]